MARLNGKSEDDKEKVQKVEEDEGKGVEGCWRDDVDGEGEQKVQIFVKVDEAK